MRDIAIMSRVGMDRVRRRAGLKGRKGKGGEERGREERVKEGR